MPSIHSQHIAVACDDVAVAALACGDFIESAPLSFPSGTCDYRESIISSPAASRYSERIG
jgi:hypothetical protein